MSNKKDIKFPARTKASAADLKKESEPTGEIPIIGEQKPAQLQLKPFPDGVPLRHSPNPNKPGTFIIHDSTGLPLAISLHQAVADLICRSVTFLFFEQAKANAKREAEAKELGDALDSAPTVVGNVAPQTPANVEPLPTTTPDANKHS